MRYYIYITLFLLINCTFIFSQNGTTDKGTISVKIENLKNDKGQIRACLFHTQEGFPDKPEKAYKIIKTLIIDKDNLIINFKDINFGEYAIAILHDEDCDDKMKTGIFGIPAEGYGISKDAKGVFGPPKFEDAKINLNSANVTVTIKMNY